MSAQIGVGVSITLPYGRIGVSGASEGAADDERNLRWPAAGHLEWPGGVRIVWPGLAR